MSVDTGRRNALLRFSSVALGVAAEKSMKAIFGVLQHYQPKADLPQMWLLTLN
jgi:hypothetical protein